MGWTGGDEPLAQVKLSFPTLKAAVAYAQWQGLTYVVERSGQSRKANGPRRPCRERAFSDATLRYVARGGLLQYPLDRHCSVGHRKRRGR